MKGYLIGMLFNRFSSCLAIKMTRNDYNTDGTLETKLHNGVHEERSGNAIKQWPGVVADYNKPRWRCYSRNGNFKKTEPLTMKLSRRF